MAAIDVFGTFLDPLNQDQGASKLVNCRIIQRLQLEQKPAKSRLIGTPGLTRVCRPTASPCIVLCHAVGMETVWSGHADGTIFSGVETVTPILQGSVTVDPVTPIIRMAEDRSALVIASNGTDGGGFGSGYKADLVSGVQFGDLQATINFDPTSVCVIDNYTIWAGASNIYSNQDDKMYSAITPHPTTVDANHFSVAEARADPVLDVVTLGRTFWPFGTRSVEMWYNKGSDADFGFTAFTNSLLEVGLAARRTLASIHGIVIWIATDRRVWMGKGQSGNPISPGWVDLLLQQIDLQKLTAYMYAQGGDEFYVLTLEGQWTIELALSTMIWNYRQSPGRPDHASRCALEHDKGVTYVGLDTGDICKLDMTTANEPYGQLERSVVTPWFGTQDARSVIDEIDVTSYMGPEAGSFTLDWSEDRMTTWKGQRTIVWPEPGTRRAIARRLGSSRRRQVRLTYQGAKAPFEIDELFVQASNEI